MRIYTTWLPLFLTALIVTVYAALPVKPALVGASGLASALLTLVSTLPGFYFAGLAAAATFGNSTMDNEMPAPAPEVDMVVSGAAVTVKLTRRLFLSYLFSYLVILSFVFCFALVAINAAAPSIESWRTVLSPWTWLGLKAAIGTILVFIFASIVISTLHGIFFLTEKIHQP